jgi:hypothetical protein
MSDRIADHVEVQVQILPTFLDRWLKIGEGDDQIQGIKLEKYGDFYVLLLLRPDGTGEPISWPEDAVTFMDAYRETEHVPTET